MIRTKYEVTRRTENSVEVDAEFEKDITYAYSNHNEIYNYFSRYRFVDFWRDFWDEYNCRLKCSSKYYLEILSDTGCLFLGKFLVSTMDITVRGEEPSFLALPSFDSRGNPIQEINSILQDESIHKQIKVYIAMEIEYFLSYSLDPLNNLSVYEISERIIGRPLTEHEREELDHLHDETEDLTVFSCAVETPFTTDKCCICLTEEPNIISIPCLHKSVCFQCEEKGKLTKCPTCRLLINRKIKI